MQVAFRGKSDFTMFWAASASSAAASSPRPLQPEPQPDAIGALMRHARRTRDAEERFERARGTYELALFLARRNSSMSPPASEEELMERSAALLQVGDESCAPTSSKPQQVLTTLLQGTASGSAGAAGQTGASGSASSADGWQALALRLARSGGAGQSLLRQIFPVPSAQRAINGMQLRGGRPLAPGGGGRPLAPLKPCPPPPWMISMFALMASTQGKGPLAMIINLIKRMIAMIKFKLTRIASTLKRIMRGGVIVPVLDDRPLKWDFPTKVPFSPIKPDLGPRQKPPRWWFVPPRWYAEAPHWILAPPFPDHGEQPAALLQLDAAFAPAGADAGADAQAELPSTAAPASSRVVSTEQPTTAPPAATGPAAMLRSAHAASEEFRARSVANSLRLEAMHRKLLKLVDRTVGLVEASTSRDDEAAVEVEASAEDDSTAANRTRSHDT